MHAQWAGKYSHIAFPGTIYSKGYEEENACKPKVTLTIEATDGGSTPEFVASVILGGTYPLFSLSLLPRSSARHVTPGPRCCWVHSARS